MWQIPHYFTTKMKGIAKLQLLIMLHTKELGFYSQIMMKMVQIGPN